MTAFKYWDSATSSWKVLGAVQGPVGPPGPAGGPGPATLETHIGPSAPSPRGDYTLWLDTDEPDPTPSPMTVYRTRVNGGGVTLPQAMTALSGLALTFTTPAYLTSADVFWRTYFVAQAAAWGYAGTKVICTPAPSFQASQGQDWTQIQGTYNTAMTYNAVSAHDYLEFAASTVYTLQLHAGFSQAHTWSNDWSYLWARLFPR